MSTSHKKMSWEGKNHDHTKSTAKSTLGNDPITRDELAEVEENILRILDEISDKIAANDPAVKKKND